MNSLHHVGQLREATLLNKNIIHLKDIDLEQFRQVALQYYSANAALVALEQAQDKFRAAVASGVFTSEKAQSVLHELEDLAQSHQQTTQAAFSLFQDMAFTVLGQGMQPGFRGELIELTEKTPSLGTSPNRTYTALCYARLDVHLTRWGADRGETLTLYVSPDVHTYGGPDESKGITPSSCRRHTFRPDWNLSQTWDWRIASL